jgi:hypothetical protein
MNWIVTATGFRTLPANSPLQRTVLMMSKSPQRRWVWSQSARYHPWLQLFVPVAHPLNHESCRKHRLDYRCHRAGGVIPDEQSTPTDGFPRTINFFSSVASTEQPMEFNDLLAQRGIDPKVVLIMRHAPRHARRLYDALPRLAAEQPEMFNAYQQVR